MAYVKRHNVYSYATLKECRETTGAEPISTRWLDTDKGDSVHPLYRSRWVAQQYRRAWIETLFAATPQLETARLLLADAARRSRTKEDPAAEIRTMLIDISRAFF